MQRREFSVRVYERPDRAGRYEVCVRDRAGGRSRKQFETKAAAEAYAAEVERVGHQRTDDPRGRTVGAMIEGYIQTVKETLRPKGGLLEPSTVKHRQEMLVALRDFFGASTPVRDVSTDEQFGRFEAHRRPVVEHSTWRANAWACKQAFGWAHRRGWISAMPSIVVPPAPPPRQEWLRTHEIAPFLDACSGAFRPLAEAALFFGLREGEICFAQVEDFDLAAGVLWVRPKPELRWKPKGGLARGVPLRGRGLRIAQEICKRPASEWAWPNLGGAQRQPGTWFSRATRRALAGAGIARDLYFHDLRRTFGATMIAAGASVRAVQRALGHSSVTVTERTYAPICNSQVARELEMMDAHLDQREAEYRAQNPSPPPRKRIRVVK